MSDGIRSLPVMGETAKPKRKAKASKAAPAGVGHNADGQLRSIFERWSRLEEEKAQVSSDLKDLFAEAKGNGFETKALRLAFRMKVKAENETDADRETMALVDTYLAGLGSPRARPTRVRVENIEQFDPETGEITEIGPAASAGRTDSSAVAASPSPEADTAEDTLSEVGPAEAAALTAPAGGAADATPAPHSDPVIIPSVFARPVPAKDAGPIPDFLDRRKRA